MKVRIMFYVYILCSKLDNKLYTGYTNDLKRRVAEHNSGKEQSTRHRHPFVLVYYEAYRSKEDAIKREQMLKLQSHAMGGLKRRIKRSINLH